MGHVTWNRRIMVSVTSGWICPTTWSSRTTHGAVVHPQQRRRTAQSPAPCSEDAGALFCAEHVLLDQKPSLSFNRAKLIVAHLELSPAMPCAVRGSLGHSESLCATLVLPCLPENKIGSSINFCSQKRPFLHVWTLFKLTVKMSCN